MLHSALSALARARTCALGLAMAVLVSSPALGQSTCILPDQSGYFTAIVRAQNVTPGAINCFQNGHTEVTVIVFEPGGCLGASGLFLRCFDSTQQIGFVACTYAHLLTPVNGGNWGAIGGGLCGGFLNYLRIP